MSEPNVEGGTSEPVNRGSLLQLPGVKDDDPTSQAFQAVIASTLNLVEDRVQRDEDGILRIGASGTENADAILLCVPETQTVSGVETVVDQRKWVISAAAPGAENNTGFEIREHGASNGLFIEKGTRNVGIGTRAPKALLHVDGAINASQLTLGGQSVTKIVKKIAEKSQDSDLPTAVAVRDYVVSKTSDKISTGELQDDVKTGESNPPTCNAVKKFVNAAIPIGAIIMWSGKTPPSGWHLCDGSTGAGKTTRPDLRSRFIMGSDEKQVVGTKGGASSASVTLEEKHLPPHEHELTINQSSPHSHALTYYFDDYQHKGAKDKDANLLKTEEGNARIDTGLAGAHSHTGKANKNATATAAEAFTVDTMPPYYVLAFIIRES